MHRYCPEQDTTYWGLLDFKQEMSGHDWRVLDFLYRRYDWWTSTGQYQCVLDFIRHNWWTWPICTGLQRGQNRWILTGHVWCAGTGLKKTQLIWTDAYWTLRDTSERL